MTDYTEPRQDLSVWTGADGKEIRVCDMKNRHLQNTERFLRRKLEEAQGMEIKGEAYQTAVRLLAERADYMRRELDRRGIPAIDESYRPLGRSR